jgi:hypothetical protein
MAMNTGALEQQTQGHANSMCVIVGSEQFASATND